MIPIEHIKDKIQYLIMDVQNTTSHVFISMLPNSKEVE